MTLTAFSCGSRKSETPDEVARIVTLTPSGTELVATLDAGDRLVGVDDYSDGLEAAEGLPRVGGFLDPSVEAIIALNPDLVILDNVQKDTGRALEQTGIATLVLTMHTVADIRRGLESVGEAIGAEERAAARVDAIDAALRAREGAERDGPRPVVLPVIDRERGRLAGVITAGSGTYLDELLALLGAENAVAAAGARYPKVGLEEILRSEATVILDASPAGADPGAASDWKRAAAVPAVARGRIHSIADRLFQAPSPRVAEALDRLEELVYGSAP